MKLTLILLLLLISFFALADTEELDLDSFEEIEKPSLKFRDSKTGLINDDFTISQDKSRISLIYNFNKDPASFTGLQGFEGHFAKKFSGHWFEFFGLIMKADYSEVFTPRGSTEQQNKSTDSFKAFGASYALQDDWCQDFLGSKSIFTITSVGVGYYLYNNELTQESYSGFGLKADFGLHNRSSEAFHYGFKMSYHLVPLKRSSEEANTSSLGDSLTATWLNLGLDLSLYF